MPVSFWRAAEPALLAPLARSSTPLAMRLEACRKPPLATYEPDLIWFDFGIRFVPEVYKRQFLADYYNREAE